MASTSHDTSRRPRRLGRKLLYLVLGLIGLVILLLAILPAVVSLDSIKGQIVTRAEQALQREVEVGEVHLQIFTGLGAGLEQLTIHNPPGWQQPHFVKVGTLSVKVAFWPLLQRKVDISKIILSDGDIFLERDAKGRMNYDDLIQPTTPAKPASSSPPPGETGPGANPLAALSVSKVSLDNVNVSFIDRMVIPGKTLTTTARNTQVDLSNIALHTPIKFDVSTALLTDAGRNLRLRGQVGPIPETLAFDRVPIEANLQAKNLVLDHLVPYLGPQPVLTAGRLDADVKVQGNPSGSVTVNGSTTLTQAVLRDTSGNGQAITLPKVTLAHDLTVDRPQALLTLRTLRLDLSPLQATLQGSIATFTSTPQLDVQLNTNEFSVAEVLKKLPMLAASLPTAANPQGQMQLQATAKGTTTRLQSTGRVALREVSMQTADGATLTLPQVSLTEDTTLDMQQALLQLAEVRLDLGTVQATVKGTVRTFTTTPQLDLQLASNDFAPEALLSQLPMLASALPTPYDVQGRVHLQSTIKGTLANLRTDSRLSIDSLALKSGTFHGAKTGGGMLLETSKTQAAVQAHVAAPRPPDVQVDLRSARLVFDQQADAAAAPSPAPPSPAPAPSTAPPVNLRGKVAITEGRLKHLTFRDLTADLSVIEGLLKSSQQLTVYSGTVQGQVQADLTKDAPDYTLSMRLENVNAGELVNELTSVQNILLGNLNTDFKFSGQGLTWEGISKTLTGAANVHIADLKLTTLDLLPKLAVGLQGVSKLAGFSLPQGLTERAFDTMRAAFQIEQGKLRTDNLKLLAKDVEVLAKGWLGLDKSLDFEGIAFLLDNLANALGNRAKFLQDQQGRVPLPFAVRGTVTNPQVVPNEAFLIDLAQQHLAKQVEEKAGKEVQKLLEKTPLGKTGEQAPSTSEGVQQEMQKLLEKTPLGKPKTSEAPGPDKSSEQPKEPPKPTVEDTLKKGFEGLFKR